jgi:hypothetical protein
VHQVKEKVGDYENEEEKKVHFLAFTSSHLVRYSVTNVVGEKEKVTFAQRLERGLYICIVWMDVRTVHVLYE